MVSARANVTSERRITAVSPPGIAAVGRAIVGNAGRFIMVLIVEVTMEVVSISGPGQDDERWAESRQTATFADMSNAMCGR